MASMTFAELQAAVQTHADSAELDAAQLALWLNEAQNDLSLEFGPVKSMTYDGSDGTAVFSIPDDCVEILEADADYAFNSYGGLVFDGATVATIHYRAFAAPFTGTDATQVSELPAAVHHLMPWFVVSRYWLTEAEGDGEEMTQSNTYMQYYLAGKAQMLSRLKAQMGSRPTAWKIV